MTAVTAYYLPADSASAIDTSHRVSVEQLNRLGWRISSVGGGTDEIEQAGRKLAQKLGLPVTKEGCVVPFNLEKDVSRMAPEMHDLLTKTAKVQNNDILTSGGIIAITSGSPYMDIEDVTAARWDRIHLGAGTLVCTPIGAKYRIAYNEQSRGTTGIIFFKETISTQELSVHKEIDNHPDRQAYLRAQAFV
ncbi:hypothetical protein BDP27DRAFT_1368291 [Rhodocollybia butyracea]|uniref:Uncharacterized protein n=1 Tax=Rhodocollybia butyracea TaxID=206335 RepID=A0A9P5U1P7_9AGAR|nr:hypothetical protein BDP27DRAFT_1368291 [Rhodocollybia butyracea]